VDEMDWDGWDYDKEEKETGILLRQKKTSSIVVVSGSIYLSNSGYNIHVCICSIGIKIFWSYHDLWLNDIQYEWQGWGKTDITVYHCKHETDTLFAWIVDFAAYTKYTIL